MFFLASTWPTLKHQEDDILVLGFLLVLTCFQVFFEYLENLENLETHHNKHLFWVFIFEVS